jgi:hypothetical protein
MGEFTTAAVQRLFPETIRVVSLCAWFASIDRSGSRSYLKARQTPKIEPTLRQSTIDANCAEKTRKVPAISLALLQKPMTGWWKMYGYSKHRFPVEQFALPVR